MGSGPQLAGEVLHMMDRTDGQTSQTPYLQVFDRALGAIRNMAMYITKSRRLGR